MLVQRQLGVALHVAAMRAGEEFFAALGRPFHRTLQGAGAVGRHHVFGVGAGLHAKTTADVADQHAHLLMRQTERIADRIARARGHLGAQVNRQAPAGRVKAGQHGTRLQRERGHALVRHVQRHHVRCPGKGGRRGLGIAVAHFGRDVVGRLIA